MSVLETIKNIEERARKSVGVSCEAAAAMARTEHRCREVIEHIESPRSVSQLKSLAEVVQSCATMLRECAERNQEAFSDLQRCMEEQRQLLERFTNDTN